MKLTREAVTAAIEKVVAEKGADYVYDREHGGCTYSEQTPEGVVPSCIVGHVIAKMDPELFQRVAEYESETGGFWWTGVDIRIPGIEQDSAVKYALREAQDAQDDGDTWGEALEAFHAAHGRRSTGIGAERFRAGPLPKNALSQAVSPQRTSRATSKA